MRTRGTDRTLTEAERRAEQQRFERIDAAFRAGDLAALRAAVEDPKTLPNGPMPLPIGSCLEYAIYHSPLRSFGPSWKWVPIQSQKTTLGFRR